MKNTDCVFTTASVWDESDSEHVWPQGGSNVLWKITERLFFPQKTQSFHGTLGCNNIYVKCLHAKLKFKCCSKLWVSFTSNIQVCAPLFFSLCVCQVSGGGEGWSKTPQARLFLVRSGVYLAVICLARSKHTDNSSRWERDRCRAGVRWQACLPACLCRVCKYSIS